jgi:hypothetical protein
MRSSDDNQIVTEEVKVQGMRTFVAAYWGDDFVVVTSPERYEKICLATIDSFDKMVLISTT